MKQKFSVDPANYARAKEWLADTDGHTEEDVRELAQDIQDVCEEKARDVERRVEAYMSRVGT